MNRIKAPWTKEQVKNLNDFQNCEEIHPYTCGGNRKDKHHLDNEGVLLATENGWVCKYCDYTQDWCADFLANQTWNRNYNIDFSEVNDIIGYIERINSKNLEDFIINGNKLSADVIEELKFLGVTNFTIISQRLWEEV